MVYIREGKLQSSPDSHISGLAFLAMKLKYQVTGDKLVNFYVNRGTIGFLHPGKIVYLSTDFRRIAY